ncbi:MAG: histidine phosphatase family protein [Pseudomonadota bacterium]
MLIGFIRHAQTEWNVQGRLQGRSDIPLNAQGIAAASAQAMPCDLPPAKYVTSPLQRARHTGELLIGKSENLVCDARLAEMSFGDWEGQVLAQLRLANPKEVAQRENMGREFCAPNGETPAQVMERLCDFCDDYAKRETLVIAFSHKAVIRAAMALATGWNMIGRPPWKLDFQALHMFAFDRENGQYPLQAVGLDIALDGGASFATLSNNMSKDHRIWA